MLISAWFIVAFSNHPYTQGCTINSSLPKIGQIGSTKARNHCHLPCDSLQFHNLNIKQKRREEIAKSLNNNCMLKVCQPSVGKRRILLHRNNDFLKQFLIKTAMFSFSIYLAMVHLLMVKLSSGSQWTCSLRTHETFLNSIYFFLIWYSLFINILTC